MPKTDFTQYDKDPANNTDIDGVDIAEGCAPSGINNAIRSVMSHIAEMNDGTVAMTSPSIPSISGSVDVTGTVTADGLTLNDGTNTVDITSSGSDTRLGFVADRTSSNLSAFRFQDSSGEVRLDITDGGDISFYEDTGTDAKLFWDASAESLGIGATTVDATLQVGALNTTGSNRGAVSIKTEASDATIGESAIYIEEQSGSEGYYIGVESSGGLFFSNSGQTTPTLFLDDSNHVGIGTSSPAQKIHAQGSSGTTIIAERTGANAGFSGIYGSNNPAIVWGGSSDSLRFAQIDDTSLTNFTERMRIDSSGNVLVGQSSSVAPASDNVAGIALASAGYISASRSSVSAEFNKSGANGDIVVFRKAGSAVGSIGVLSDLYTYFNSENNTGFLASNGTVYYGWDTARFYPNSDNARDLGISNRRWDDVYATNGTIQTSDRNEKENIASMSDAEITAAKAISKLFKTFKWKDAVAEKGDSARTHAGVIAQDVQQAMADAGLDAGNYAFFISSTWWETQTEVPAVEAVEAVDAVYEDVVIPAVEEQLDEEGNVIVEAQPERVEQRLVSEAVEAVEGKEAYTRTDTYDTAEEAPEGATERTRLGIRYPELLAFIGAATEQRLASIEARLDALEA